MSAAKLYVGNLPYNTDENALAGAFSQYGTVVSCRIITDRETGRSKGFGFVEMENSEGATQAIEALNGQDFSGRKIVVSEARENNDRPRGGGGGGGRGRDGGGRGPRY